MIENQNSKGRTAPHIREMRKSIDRKLKHDPIRKIDGLLSHKGISASLTVLLFLVIILASLGAGTAVVIFIF